jgi:alpha-galactosidase
MGLCHSVQGTSHKLAKYAEVPYSELDWDCAGINHLAWFTRLEHNGRDLYPLLKNKLEEDPELRSKDPVRLDIMKHLGYFVTESSGHFSEYLPYYRKRKELIDEYCGKRYLGESGFYARGWPTWRVENDNMRKKYIAGEEKLEIKRTWEYASYIIEAMETNSPFVAHVTMPNNGRITNLPDDGVVETATLMDRNGATPVHFGKLPPQCAALCDWNMRMFELAATACIERSKEAAVHALMLDPLTAAVCSPAEIREMTYRLFEAEKDFLPEYK